MKEDGRPLLFDEERAGRALAFAGGAMLFVFTGEIIPETHRADTRRS